MTYHNTLRFADDLERIYAPLQTSPQLSAVCRVVSGIPHQNGVAFCWQGKRFRINWYKGYWYVSAKAPFFWSVSLQEIITFCLLMTTTALN